MTDIINIKSTVTLLGNYLERNWDSHPIAMVGDTLVYVGDILLHEDHGCDTAASLAGVFYDSKETIQAAIRNTPAGMVMHAQTAFASLPYGGSHPIPQNKLDNPAWAFNEFLQWEKHTSYGIMAGGYDASNVPGGTTDVLLVPGPSLNVDIIYRISLYAYVHIINSYAERRAPITSPYRDGVLVDDLFYCGADILKYRAIPSPKVVTLFPSIKRLGIGNEIDEQTNEMMRIKYIRGHFLRMTGWPQPTLREARQMLHEYTASCDDPDVDDPDVGPTQYAKPYTLGDILDEALSSQKRT